MKETKEKKENKTQKESKEQKENKAAEKKKEYKHIHPSALIMSALALAIAVFSLYNSMSITKTAAEQEVVAEDISYRVYIGLTDKNQKRQIIANDVAVEIVKTICMNNNAGYTIYIANGGFREKDGFHTENTIVLEMDRIDDDTLDVVMNDIKRRLNVNTLFVTKNSLEIFNY